MFSVLNLQFIKIIIQYETKINFITQFQNRILPQIHRFKELKNNKCYSNYYSLLPVYIIILVISESMALISNPSQNFIDL